MIYIFRKEIRKWYPILWLVFISLAISGIYGFFSSPGSEIAVGKINGSKILFSQYRRALSDIYARIENIKNYARQYGISSEVFLAGILGGRSPEQFAQDQCVHDALVDQVKKSINPQLDKQWFSDELIKMFPAGVVNEQGALNMDVYKGYLQKMGTTPAQFEEDKEEGFKRNLILNFVRTFDYTPEHELFQDFEQKKSQKSFSILVFNVNDFIKKAREESVDEKEIELFYQRHKESYRIPEMRKATYWLIDTERYGESIEIDEDLITRFYERNKSTEFRNPPTVTVKRIVLAATKENRPQVYEQAKELQAQLKKNPELFDEFVTKHSSLKKNAELTISGRGEHESDIENAAFRLNKVNDISTVVRTMKGYEILKLIKRIAAVDKPLDVVRADIIKTLKARRLMSKLKGDLEAVIRGVKTDESVLQEFVASNRLKEVETDWLTQNHQADKKSIESELAKKIFAKTQSGFGFIQYENNFILFKVGKIQASEIPPFSQVKDEVTDAFYKTKGQDLLKSTLRNAKTSLLNKTQTPEELSKKMDADLITTGLISQGKNKGTDIKELKHIAGLKPRIFVLSSPEQVLSYNFKDQYLLVKLQESIPAPEGAFEQKRDEIIKKEKMKGAMLTTDAFIASLYRNAKIDFDEHLLGINKYK